MKMLVYGTGPLGSLFAARLDEAGHDVALLARGQRLADLREHGVILEDSVTGEREVTRVKVVEALAPDDFYDVVLVVMRKNHALDILPVLAANQRVPTVLFMMNNAAGHEALIEAVGKERVLLGFPLPGGHRDGPVMRMVPDRDAGWEIPIGEVDGRITARTRRVAAALAQMRGYKVDIRTDMDAWLRHHVAIVGPLAAALYATDTDQGRMVRTRDALVLGTRGMKEALRGLEQAGYPISPPVLRALFAVPEPLLLSLVRGLLSIESLKVSLEGHARAARDEMTHLMLELREVIATTDAETPALERLYPHLDAETPPLHDASCKIPVRWQEMVVPTLVTVGTLAGVVLITRRLCARKKKSA